MIKPVNCTCPLCGFKEEKYENTRGEFNPLCGICGESTVPDTVQLPGFRTDHTWDDDLITR